jgi:hypothetical protein
MNKKLPLKVYRCPECGYATPYRWLLKNHLYNVHNCTKRAAAQTALENEYWLNPTYYRRRDLEKHIKENE